MIPTFKPKCPNHGAPLEGMGFPLPRKGQGMCPVSGASFDFEAEIDTAYVQLDKFGNATKSVGWKVSGSD
jgi:hypothetical protein